ncbi:MAG TPA: hypothetical protein VN803_06885 [Gemmatimonadales bacterium]|nr:hypothetical protein [Gemmatimonadales bacterium]
MTYRVLPKTGPDHSIAYPIGAAFARILAAPAGSEERARIREEEAAAGGIKVARAGDVVDDLPQTSVDALLEGGDIERVVDVDPRDESEEL